MRNAVRFKSLVAALLLVSMASCSWFSSSGNKNGGRGNSNSANANSASVSDNTPIQVTLGKSESRQVQSTIEATGSLVAQETSDIAPKVAGKVSNVYVNVGQFVSGGTLIAKLDDTGAKIQLATANAAVKQAQANVGEAQAKIGLSGTATFNSSSIPEVRAANANYQEALAEQKQAENNELRYRELVESGDVAAITYDQYRTARDTARAKSNNAKELLDAAVNAAKQSNQAVVSAQAAVESARTQVSLAQQAIADTSIFSPFAGYISARPTAVGEYVSTATSVATILRTNPIKIDITIPESDVPYAGIGRGVSVQVSAYKDRNFAGTVSAVNPAIDPASRAATVEALIDNSDNALRSGMFATVKINREGGSTGVFVPKAAVYSDATTQSYRVFVIENNVAKLHVVQLGTDEGDSQQILSGLDPDQVIATSNLNQLFEGARVSS